MIDTIRDPLLFTIVPGLNNEGLSSFALTSKFTYQLSYKEIFKRSTENLNWLKAVLLLKRKSCSFIDNHSEPLLKRVEAILLRFSQNANFTFLPSILFKEEVLENLKKNFDKLLANKKLNYFYTCLQAEEENQETLQFSQNLLEEYESFRQIHFCGPSKIYLDITQPFLSFGNFVCFSIIKKNMERFQDLSKMYASFDDPCHFIDSLWHTSIYLKELKQVQSLDSPLILLQLCSEVSSLTELRVLEINWRVENSDLKRFEPYVQALLKGSISLQKLQCIRFNLTYVTDEQIRVMIESLAPLFWREESDLSLISLNCEDITLDQAVALIEGIDQIVALIQEGIDIDSRRQIKLLLYVEEKTFNHREEFRTIFDYLPHFIDFMYGIIEF